MLKGQKSNLIPEHDFHKRVATENEPKPVSQVLYQYIVIVIASITTLVL